MNAGGPAACKRCSMIEVQNKLFSALTSSMYARRDGWNCTRGILTSFGWSINAVRDVAIVTLSIT
jgi:hypothetical protein